MGCIITQETPTPVARSILAQWPALAYLHISADNVHQALHKLGTHPLPTTITTLGFSIEHDWKKGQQLLALVGDTVTTLVLRGIGAGVKLPDKFSIPTHLHSVTLVNCHVPLLRHKLPAALQHLQLDGCTGDTGGVIARLPSLRSLLVLGGSGKVLLAQLPPSLQVLHLSPGRWSDLKIPSTVLELPAALKELKISNACGKASPFSMDSAGVASGAEGAEDQRLRQRFSIQHGPA
jgi:hypothetical protein